MVAITVSVASKRYLWGELGEQSLSLVAGSHDVITLRFSSITRTWHSTEQIQRFGLFRLRKSVPGQHSMTSPQSSQCLRKQCGKSSKKSSNKQMARRLEL